MRIKIKYLIFLYPIAYLFDSLHVPFIGSPEKVVALLVICAFAAELALQKGALFYGYDVSLVFFTVFLAIGLTSAFMSPIGLGKSLRALESIFLKGALAYVVFRVIKTKRDLYICLKTYFVLMVALIILGFCASFLYRDLYILRDASNMAANPLYNGFFGATLIPFPNIVARALLVGIPFLAFFAIAGDVDHRKRYLSIYVLSCAIILMTLSRSGALAFALATALIAFRLLKGKNVHRKKTMAILVLLGLVAGYTMASNQELARRFGDLYSGAYHKELRWIELVNSYEAFKERPVMGCGPGSLAYEITKREGETRRAFAHKYFYGHNLIMNLLVQYGTLGTICFLLFCFFLLKRLISLEKVASEEDQLLARAFQITFITFFFASQFAPTLNDNHIWFFVGLAFAFCKMVQPPGLLKKRSVAFGHMGAPGAYRFKKAAIAGARRDG